MPGSTRSVVRLLESNPFVKKTDHENSIATISAIGPDVGIFCTVFRYVYHCIITCVSLIATSNDFCNMDEIDVPRPGEKDGHPLLLRNPGWNGQGLINQGWDNRIKSFYCLDNQFGREV
jgi:hypothetical protein